jgi:hypothetical protein
MSRRALRARVQPDRIESSRLLGGWVLVTRTRVQLASLREHGSLFVVDSGFAYERGINLTVSNKTLLATYIRLSEQTYSDSWSWPHLIPNNPGRAIRTPFTGHLCHARREQGLEAIRVVR